MIQITSNYQLFKPFFLNRGIQKRNLQLIKESLSKDNLLYLHPIIVTNDYEILDGSHRFEAAKLLNIPIHFIQLPKMPLEQLINMLISFNFNMSKWGTFQFLQLYCKLNKKEYLEFKEFQEHFKLDSHLALPISKLREKARNVNPIFRKGDYVFEDKEKIYTITRNALEFIETGKQMLLYTSNSPYMTRHYFYAYGKLMESVENFSQQKMLTQLNSFGIKLIPSPNLSIYYTQLSNLYNKRADKGNKREKEAA